MNPTGTDRYSEKLRRASVRTASRSILVSRIKGTDQEPDLREPANCGGFGRVRHFGEDQGAGWPRNPLPTAPARRRLGLPPGGGIRAQVFQNAACNWRCWYCYVPFGLLAADPAHSEFMTASDLVDGYASLRERPPVLVLSGGQPDLVPEWVPWIMSELRSRGMDATTYLWSDDNLSNDYFWRYLTRDDLEAVRGFRNYGRACCFKGFDAESFRFNTSASPCMFGRQFDLAGRLAGLGIDVYAYVTMTTPRADGMREAVAAFVDRLQRIDRLLPLRTVPLRIDASYTPVKKRGGGAGRSRVLENQHAALRCWSEELDRRFSAGERSRPVWANALGGSSGGAAP